MEIKAFQEGVLEQCLGEPTSNPPPPLLSSIPAYLRRQVYAIPQRKRPRRRGKRGGEAVRIRAYLLSLRGKALSLNSSGCYTAPMIRQRWLLRVFPDGRSVSLPEQTNFPRRIRRGGVDHRHLRPLDRTQKPRREELTLRLPLINARSLARLSCLMTFLNPGIWTLCF